VAAFTGSDHDRAIEPADSVTVLGDFDDARFVHGGVTSTFFRRDGGFFVRTDGSDGALHEYPIEYTFGVRPLQQYLIPMPDGRYQALGIAWDARAAEAGGGRWFHLFPDVSDAGDPLHWTQPAQNWNHMCAECHSTDLRKNYRLAEDRFESRWAEIDVSCEACHGPGSRHVEWARDPDRVGEDADETAMGLPVALGNPPDVWRFSADTATARRTSVPPAFRTEVETCGRCHSRRGQVWADYRFGAPLGDTHRVALLDEGLYHADGQILDEVYEYGSFLQSRMYRAGVTCSDCHDPHSARPRAEGNALCGRCHSPAAFDTPEHHRHPAGSSGALCVECHMPTQIYMIVDPRRDHSLRIPRPDLTIKIGVPNACSGCHVDRSAEWALEAVETWFGPERARQAHYGEVIDAGRRGLPGATARLLAVLDDRELLGIVRATAVSLLRPPFSAEALAGLERAARDPEALVRRAAAGRVEFLGSPQGGRLAARLLADSVRTVRLEAVPGAAGLPPDSFPKEGAPALAAGIDEYRRSQTANADRADAHLNLGNLEVRLGQLEVAEAEYRRALARDPAFAPATINLADLYRAMGREPEAEKLLRESLLRDPDNAEARHALGLLLVRAGRLPDALEQLAQAADLLPQDPRFAYIYAIALHDAGQIERSLQVLEAAQSRHPWNPELIVPLIEYSRELGRTDAAARWAEMLETVN
jgi:tetratricopeptide (TPR) repeat protein